MNSESRFSIILLNFAIYFVIVSISNCDGQKLYTSNEKILLKDLHSRVKQNLTQGIMHENKYLVRFLRAQNHDVGRAEAMIRRTLTWRNENKIDKILKEDWSSWLQKYPITLHMVDFEGRPVMSSGVGEMDTRNLILMGEGNEMDRYFLYCYERQLHNLHHVSKASGKEFTETYFLFNMAGYNPKAHACLACIPSWIKLVQIYERHYPQLDRNIIAVNTPTIFQRVFQVLQPFMSAHSARIVRLYDTDMEKWKPELLKIFPENILTPEFGGKGSTISVMNQ